MGYEIPSDHHGPTPQAIRDALKRRTDEIPVNLEGPKEVATDKRLLKQEPGLKFDAGKPRFSLMDRLFIWGIIRVLEYGAKKYDVDNWRKGMSWNRAYDALHRHLDAWYRGEDRDPETGEYHLDHAGCCLMFLRRFSVDPRYKSFDDRHSDITGLTEAEERDDFATKAPPTVAKG